MFTPEFKAEAVRQVIKRGYTVAEIAARLVVSTHSLYKWVKAVTPNKSEKQASELLEAKSEILRLRAQMRRLEEERDILKKPRGTLPGSPSEVPIRERASPPARNYQDVSGAANCSCRVLSVAAQARF
ncbi:TPA: transposase [Pseudomonas aeruginosa]|nr:transposase [Pseudomonas aeruginosa]HEQ0195767.1 transposase [Pseudomonas aeruginosa]